MGDPAPPWNMAVADADTGKICPRNILRGVELHDLHPSISTQEISDTDIKQNVYNKD